MASTNYRKYIMWLIFLIAHGTPTAPAEDSITMRRLETATCNPYCRVDECALPIQDSLHIGFLVRQDFVDKFGPDKEHMRRMISEVVEDEAGKIFEGQFNFSLRAHAIIFPDDEELSDTEPLQPLVAPLQSTECNPNTLAELNNYFAPDADDVIPAGYYPITTHDCAVWFFVTRCKYTLPSGDHSDGYTFSNGIGGTDGHIAESAGAFAAGSLYWHEIKEDAARTFAHELGHSFGSGHTLHGIMATIDSIINGVMQYDTTATTQRAAICNKIRFVAATDHLWSPSLTESKKYIPPDDPSWCENYTNLKQWCEDDMVSRHCKNLCRM